MVPADPVTFVTFVPFVLLAREVALFRKVKLPIVALFVQLVRLVFMPFELQDEFKDTEVPTIGS